MTPNPKIRELIVSMGIIPESEHYDIAERVIRECVDLLETNGNNQFTIRTVEPESHDKTTDWMAGYEEAVKHYGSFLLKKNAKLIKKHFGVES